MKIQPPVRIEFVSSLTCVRYAVSGAPSGGSVPRLLHDDPDDPQHDGEHARIGSPPLRLLPHDPSWLDDVCQPILARPADVVKRVSRASRPSSASPAAPASASVPPPASPAWSPAPASLSSRAVARDAARRGGALAAGGRGGRPDAVAVSSASGRRPVSATGAGSRSGSDGSSSSACCGRVQPRSCRAQASRLGSACSRLGSFTTTGLAGTDPRASPWRRRRACRRAIGVAAAGAIFAAGRVGAAGSCTALTPSYPAPLATATAASPTAIFVVIPAAPTPAAVPAAVPAPIVGRPVAAAALGAPLNSVSENGIGSRASALKARRCLMLRAAILAQLVHSSMCATRRRRSLRPSRPSRSRESASSA